MNIQKIVAGIEKSGVKFVDDTKFNHFSKNDLKNISKEDLIKEATFINDFIASSNAIATMNKAALHINK